MSDSADRTLPAAETLPGTEPTRRPPRIEAGQAIGRFVVIAEVGAGAMGVVFSANDPELGRTVALKVVQPDPSAARDIALARTLREARALASVSHPNVVTIHDVGHDEGSLWIAMELIDGPTLGRFIRSKRPPWTVVLDAYLQAGHGLAAIHAAGLVHRDFKPENAMVILTGDRPRTVKVMDLGLAAAGEDAPMLGHASELVGSDTPLDGLTVDGAVLGTPMYMAPEQASRAAIDARSDQYSFCLSLFEGLYGRRPYAGDTLPELTASWMIGEIAAVSDAHVPSAIHRALLRGLAVTPSDRWPSLGELLAELAMHRQRARRWPLFAGAAVVLGLAAAAAVVLWGPRAAPCEAVDDVWDASRRARVEVAFAQTGSPLASDTFARVDRSLSTYAADWTDARREACVLRDDPDAPARLFDAALACLERRRHTASAIVDALAEADTETVARAATAVRSIEPAATCLDPAVALESVPPPDENVASAVGDLRNRLAEYERFVLAERSEEGLAELGPLLDEARELDYAPALVEALNANATLHLDVGNEDEAAALFEEAFFLAERVGNDEDAFQAAAELAALRSFGPQNRAEAERWLRHAEVHLRGDLDVALRAGFHNVQARLASRAGETRAAIEHLRDGVRVFETAPPEQRSLAYPALLILFGHELRMAGEFEEARDQFERARELIEADLGPRHPRVLDVAFLLARSDVELGEFATGTASLEALALELDGLGVPSQTVDVLTVLAIAWLRQGRIEEARAALARAIESAREQRAPAHRGLDRTRIELLLQSGEPAEALALATDVLAWSRGRFGAMHATVGDALAFVATAELQLGRIDAAETHANEASQSCPDLPGVGGDCRRRALAIKGIVLAERGDSTGAIDLLRRALARRGYADPHWRAGVERQLAGLGHED